MIMIPGLSFQEKKMVGIRIRSPWHMWRFGSISPCAFGNLVYSLPEHELVFISTVLLLL